MKKIILIIVSLVVILLILQGCSNDNHEGKVIDKTVERNPDTYINTGGKGGVILPISQGHSYELIIENKKGQRDRVELKQEVYDQFDKGDQFSNKNKKVYKNGELIDE